MFNTHVTTVAILLRQVDHDIVRFNVATVCVYRCLPGPWEHLPPPLQGAVKLLNNEAVQKIFIVNLDIPSLAILDEQLQKLAEDEVVPSALPPAIIRPGTKFHRTRSCFCLECVDLGLCGRDHLIPRQVSL